MLRIFFIVTFLFVSANCCGPIVQYVGRAVLCNVNIGSFSASSNFTITRCIDEQPGLMAIIEGLRRPDSGWGAVLIAGLLESNGRATEVTALRKCFAKEEGMLSLDLTYNMGRLNEAILNKIGNSECLAGTKFGLQQCPAVVNYDVDKYLRCVIGYCVNGVTTG